MEQPQLRYVPNTVQVDQLLSLLTLTDQFLYRNHVTSIYSRFFDAFENAEAAYRLLSKFVDKDDTKKILMCNLSYIFDQEAD